MYRQRSGSVLIVAAIGVLGVAGVYHGSRYLLGEDPIPFIQGMFRNPMTVGALAPCSSFVAEEITRPITHIGGESQQQVRVLEVGAGTGQLTQKIINRLNELQTKGSIAGYTLDLVELDEQFCAQLREKFASSSIRVHCQNVSNFVSEEKYDAIISSIPFTNLPAAVVEDILQ